MWKSKKYGSWWPPHAGETAERVMRGVRISRPTGYLWWRRYEEAGLAGLSKRSRTTEAESARTAAELETAGDRAAAALSGLGSAQAAGVAGTRAGGDDALHRPSHSVRHHQVRDLDRHQQAPGRFQRGTPNEYGRWISKVQGLECGCRPCRCWTIGSRYLLVLQAVWTNHGELVREQLASASPHVVCRQRC